MCMWRCCCVLTAAGPAASLLLLLVPPSPLSCRAHVPLATFNYFSLLRFPLIFVRSFSSCFMPGRETCARARSLSVFMALALALACLDRQKHWTNARTHTHTHTHPYINIYTNAPLPHTHSHWRTQTTTAQHQYIDIHISMPYMCAQMCWLYVACVCTKCVKENVEKTFLFARFEIILICHTTYALQFVSC